MGLPVIANTPDGASAEGKEEFQTLTQEMDWKRKKESTLGGVKRIIAVHSGKGGVGKTFLTVNVAYALADKGYEVGILDADVDCPNVPNFLGMTARLFVDHEKRFVPVNHRGVRIVSMGLTRDDEGEPFLIRGPAKHRVAIDLLTNSAWGALDYLIVDLPPGTADVPLSLLEFGGVEGILYVSTPQKESLVDTRKSIRMGKTFGIRALGLIENMSGIFGKDLARPLAEETSIPYLGTIPLSERIMQANARGDIAFLTNECEHLKEDVLRVIET